VFSIPLEEHLKLKRKREEDPNFDFDKELRSLAVKHSNGMPKWDNFGLSGDFERKGSNPN
jgi:hypothetical protein